jgi:hypothetical protein
MNKPTPPAAEQNAQGDTARQAKMLTLHAGHQPWGENDGSLADVLRAWGLDPALFVESLDRWGYEIIIRAANDGGGKLR